MAEVTATATSATNPDHAERVCDLLLHLETAPAHGFRLAATVVDAAAGVRGVVHCILDGRPFVLTPDEARLVGRCITFDSRTRVTGWLAALFETAAADAEAMALAPPTPGRTDEVA